MENAGKIASQVNNIERTKFYKLHKRMDDDFDRWMLRSNDTTKIRDTEIRVTSNAPRTFANNVQHILSSAERLITVRMAEPNTGEDFREAVAKLERLLEYAFYKADERLINLLMPTHHESQVWYSVVRGWVSGRYLVYKLDGEIIWDFLPYDPRWLTYQRGANGLLWTAYTTYRSGAELEDEYGKVVKKTPWYKPWIKEKDSYPVIDYWLYENENTKSNAVICEGEFIKDPEDYKLKSMPVLIHPVATRPPIQSGNTIENELEGYGESIFAPNRDIDDLLNKLGTMWASHANLLYKQPTIYYHDDQADPIKSTTFLAEGVFNIPMNHGRLEESPLKEISPTLVNLVNWVEQWRVRGSIPDVDIRSPAQSGTLQAIIDEHSNRVFNPQLRNLNSYTGNICRLVEEQLVQGGVGGGRIGKFNIKGILKNEYYDMDVSPLDIKKPHTIKVEFTARTPWTQMDVWQQAQMAKQQGFPQDFINEYILKIPDIKGLKDMQAIEMAEHSPKLAIVTAIKAYMKLGQWEEAKSLKDDYNMLVEQERANATAMGQPPTVGNRETGSATGTLPLAETPP